MSDWKVEDSSNLSGGIKSIKYSPESQDSPIKHINYHQSDDYDRMHANQRKIEVSFNDLESFEHMVDFARNELKDKDDTDIWVDKKNKTIALSEKLPIENNYQMSHEFAANTKKLLSEIDYIEELGEDAIKSMSSEIHHSISSISEEWDIKQATNSSGSEQQIEYKPIAEDSKFSSIKYTERHDRDFLNLEERKLKISIKDDETFKTLKAYSEENLKEKGYSNLTINEQDKSISLSENLPFDNGYSTNPDFSSDARKLLSKIYDIEPIGEKALKSLSQDLNLSKERSVDSLDQLSADTINSNPRLRKEIQRPEFKETFGHYTEEIMKSRFDKIVDDKTQTR